MNVMNLITALPTLQQVCRRADVRLLGRISADVATEGEGLQLIENVRRAAIRFRKTTTATAQLEQMLMR
jgi:hypothetical protein